MQPHEVVNGSSARSTPSRCRATPGSPPSRGCRASRTSTRLRRRGRRRARSTPGSPTGPGARFGPSYIRQALAAAAALQPGARRRSRSAARQVVDAGDIAVQPVRHRARPSTRSQAASRELRAAPDAASSPRRRPHHRPARCCGRCTRVHGPVALVHFDAHLDTWDTYFGAPYTHGTPFRRASEEGLLRRGPLGARRHPRVALLPTGPARRRGASGFTIVHCSRHRPHSASTRSSSASAQRVGDHPVYVSIDIDVLDPAHAPGTGTPEAGGLTSRELLGDPPRLRRARTWWAPTSSRSPRPTTTPRSPPSRRRTSPTSSCRCSRGQPRAMTGPRPGGAGAVAGRRRAAAAFTFDVDAESAVLLGIAGPPTG